MCVTGDAGRVRDADWRAWAEAVRRREAAGGHRSHDPQAARHHLLRRGCVTRSIAYCFCPSPYRRALTVMLLLPCSRSDQQSGPGNRAGDSGQLAGNGAVSLVAHLAAAPVQEVTKGKTTVFITH